MREVKATPSVVEKHTCCGITFWDNSLSFWRNIVTLVWSTIVGLVLLNMFFIPIILFLTYLAVNGLWSFYVEKCRPRLEPQELRALFTQATEATTLVNEAKASYARCKEEMPSDEAVDASLDNLMLQALKTTHILKAAAETLDFGCHHASLWKRTWYRRHHDLQFTWLGTVERLHIDYLAAEDGDFLTVNPSSWETIAEHFDEEQQRVFHIKQWDKKERSLFTRRWLRVHPSKPVQVITAGCRYVTGYYDEPVRLSRSLNTKEELYGFVENELHYYPKHVIYVAWKRTE